MAETFVQLPSDSGNSGKKIYTITSVVGSDTVHAHVNVLIDSSTSEKARIITGDPTATPSIAALVTRNIPHGIQAVSGVKSNNEASPDATNIGVLPAIASTSAQSYTDGRQALPRLNLAGDTAVTLDGESVSVTGTVTSNAGSGTFIVGDGGSSITIDGTINADLNSGSNIVGKVGIDQTVPGVTNAVYVKYGEGTFAISGIKSNNTAPGETNLGILPAIVNAEFPSYTETNQVALSVNTSGVLRSEVSQRNSSLLHTTVYGNAEHDAQDSYGPVKVGYQARTSNPTAVANGDRVNGIADDLGRQVVLLNHIRDNETHNTATITGITETTVLSAVGEFLDPTMIILTNLAQTATRIDIRDAVGGTIRLSIGIAGQGGAVIPFNIPLTQIAANNAWTCQGSVITTDVRAFFQAVKNI